MRNRAQPKLSAKAIAEHKAFLAKMLGDKKKKKSKPKVLTKMQTGQSLERESPSYPSLNSGDFSCTTKKPEKKYTGDYVVGLATMHKSNTTVVTRDVDPKIYSTMRRN